MLEKVGVLQAFTTDDPPKRLRPDAEVVYKSVFAAFCFYTLFVYWVSTTPVSLLSSFSSINLC
jgi:hypothetical protein